MDIGHEKKGLIIVMACDCLIFMAPFSNQGVSHIVNFFGGAVFCYDKAFNNITLLIHISIVVQMKANFVCVHDC